MLTALLGWYGLVEGGIGYALQNAISERRALGERSGPVLLAGGVAAPRLACTFCDTFGSLRHLRCPHLPPVVRCDQARGYHGLPHSGLAISMPYHRKYRV